MHNKSDLTREQSKAIYFMTNNPHGIVIADTGIGKTIISLSAIAKTGGKYIVVAPPKVLSNWPVEAKKWEHTRHLKLTLLTGTPEERSEKLKASADILLISLNLLEWLLDKEHGCTGIIIDEISKASGKQAAKLRNRANDKISRRFGLTATPVSEDFIKLFPMLRIIDSGLALGKNKQNYLLKYFYPTDFKQYNWQLSPGSDALILDKIRHLICDVVVSKKDTLPAIEHKEIIFAMPENTRAIYKKMKKDLLIESDSSDAVAVNMAVLSGKLRQIASGFVITEDEETLEFDTARAAALLHNLPESALIIYEYNNQRSHIEKALAGKKFLSVFGGSDSATAISAFKSGNIDYLVAQKSTISHGIDGLQFATNNIIFYHPLWSNDSYLQAIGRIWRQGQKYPVTSTTIICEHTIDEIVADRLISKSDNMTKFIKHLRG
jgi:superfamily II DNA or RNA helicase